MSQHCSLSQEYHAITKRKHHSEQVKLSALYAFKNGDSIRSICSNFKISRTTFFYWRRQWDSEKSVKPLPKTGRKTRLTNTQQEKLLTFYNKNPTATNEQGSNHIEGAVKPRTISNYLRNSNFTRKKVSDEPPNYPDERVLQETRDYIASIEDIPLENRVYMDESFVYDNEAPSRGRSLRGKRISRQRKKHGKKWTFYLAIRINGIVHSPLISTENANDANFLDYVRNVLSPQLKEGNVVIWDRLGKAGRCKNPKKQHFNPEAKELIQSKGAKLLFLPPLGKYFNPIELAFGTVKTRIRNTYTVSEAARENRARTEQEVREIVKETCEGLSKEQIEGFFRERGSGREFIRMYGNLL